MTTDDAIPTAAELWTLLQDQAAQIADLKAEVERQRVEKLSLTSRLAEMEGGHSPNDRKLSRAGLLKAAAIGAAASVGAGSLLQASSGTALAASGSFDASGAGASAVTATATSGAEGIHATSDTHIGIYGQSTSSYAIYGDSSSGRGVYGHSTSNIGIEGQSSDGFGVYGSSTNTHALYGSSINGAGVFGVGAYGGEFGGGLASLRLLLPGNAGPPTTSSHFAGELSVDSGGVLWTCVTPGTPGTWVPLMHGNSNDGSNNALLTKVSTQQYTLTSSDGTSWVNLDATNLSLTFTPEQNALAIISGNSDLWTSNAGYNQDLGISLSGGSYPSTAGQPEAWKESGGFAGTNSPNAAFVQTVQQLVAFTAYTIKLQWKTNKSAAGAKIWAGAGPIGGKFSPTRLTVLLVPSP
jgi:hypothetical protein